MAHPRDRAPLDCEHAGAATIGGLFVMGGISGEVSFLGVTGWGDQWGSVGFGIVVDKVRVCRLRGVDEGWLDKWSKG